MQAKPPPVRLGVRIAVLLALAILPALAGALDQPFLLDLALRIMILSVAAVSLNLILGYGGMISFGHAAYIGIGAYAVGIPAYYGEYSGYLQLPLAIGAGTLFALVTGYICLRTKGVYFIMITLAFAQMAYFAFVSIEEYGGDDGLVIEQRSEFSGIIDMESTLEFYYVVLAFLFGALYLVSRIVNARFGMVVQGAKANDERMQSLGFDTFRYRLACYVIAGAAAAAGWLMGNYNYFFSPEMMSWTHSGELIFMVVLGGAGSLFGPVLGAIVLIILEELLSSATVYWPLILGAILVAVVLFARGGLEGALAMLERRK
ncbi:MAG: branched-chain amino acid ABC transporter permease [Alphaproteobacteria bacterium]|nr:branched-chain amino acid ABC transporter permease [Alphaproteobacteria bacterium]